jgi:excisionase family DNA binding protein
MVASSVMTVKQAAQALGISPSLVYGLCTNGRIRHERYGLGRGTIRISPAALDEYRKSDEQHRDSGLVHIKHR